MQPPTVQSLDEILANLQPGYQQQENLYNQQIGNIGTQTQSAVQGLDVAKQNSFRDINRNANSKGLAFSGIPVEEQTRYVGEKYLPAVANLKSQAQNQQFTLEQALAGLGTEKRNFALTTQQGQQKSLADYQQREQDYQRQVAAAELSYQRDMEKLRQEQSFTASQNAADRAAKGGGTTDLRISKNAQGGWDVLENGKKSSSYDLNAYARATGANIVDLLRNGDAKDRQAAAYYDQKIAKYGTKNQAKFLDELKRDRGTAFYLGG